MKQIQHRPDLCQADAENGGGNTVESLLAAHEMERAVDVPQALARRAVANPAIPSRCSRQLRLSGQGKALEAGQLLPIEDQDAGLVK